MIKLLKFSADFWAIGLSRLWSKGFLPKSWLNMSRSLGAIKLEPSCWVRGSNLMLRDLWVNSWWIFPEIVHEVWVGVIKMTTASWFFVPFQNCWQGQNCWLPSLKTPKCALPKFRAGNRRNISRTKQLGKNTGFFWRKIQWSQKLSCLKRSKAGYPDLVSIFYWLFQLDDSKST